MNRRRGSTILIVFFLGFLAGCGGLASKIKPDSQSVQFSSQAIEDFPLDDGSLKTLKQVLELHIEYWSLRPSKVIRWSDHYSISSTDYIKALKGLMQKVKRKNRQAIGEYIQTNFKYIYVEEKNKAPGDAFFTSYFEPVLPASQRRDDRFFQPIYEVPKNMVVVDMGAWSERFPRWSVWKNISTEKKSRSAVLRGRLVESNQIPKVVPFYSREEIINKGVLHKQAKVIAYLDPIDSFFLQIQGSGALKFKNGKVVRVGYAAQNGHPYTPIGKFMFDAIPRNEMSLQSIESFLQRLPADDRHSFLNLNASFVFFRYLKGRGETYLGTEVVDGRTIATDTAYYPKGVLAHISIPGFQNPKTNKSVTRIVVDQDTGGAIRGAGRVDLFWGQGDEAKAVAGKVKHPGKLFYLFPKVRMNSEDGT